MQEENFTFRFETPLPLSKKEAFNWHKRPGMVERLNPPFLNTVVMTKDFQTAPGEILHIKYMLFGNVGIDAFFKIIDYKEGESFTDYQIKGPFSFWEHHHRFKEVDSEHCILEDEIIFKIPLESILGALINNKIAKRLHHLFSYRRQVLLNDIDFQKRYPEKKLHILMTGANGLIGSALSCFLKMMGHNVMPITRHLQADQKGIFWDIENQKINPQDLEDYDALIHLAGESVVGIWTEGKKEKIYKSRIHSTKLLVKTLNGLKSSPDTFICASGVSYYAQGEKSTEESKAGTGFLAQVVKDWEHEASLYNRGRVAMMRTGGVLTPKGGALKKVLSSFELGLGAKIGRGQNHFSWIAIDDLVYQYYHVLMTSSIEGPVNATSPHYVTTENFSKSLAKTLKRPFFLQIPEGIMKSIFGEMAHEMILTDLIVEPKKLSEHGAKFYYADLEYALKHLLGDF